MVISWNGIYNKVGEIRLGEQSYDLLTNHPECCSMIFNNSQGIVFQAGWKDPRWKTLLKTRKISILLEILDEYAKTG